MAGIVAPAWRRNNAPDYGSAFRVTTEDAGREAGIGWTRSYGASAGWVWSG